MTTTEPHFNTFRSFDSQDLDHSGSDLNPQDISNLRSPTIPPGIDPTKQQLAYGRHAVPKLISDLTPTTPLQSIQSSLTSLSDLFHAPENVAQGLECGIVEILGKWVGHSDVTVRQKATECLKVLGGHAIGRASMVQCSTLVPLSKLFDDPDPLVRKTIHTTFSYITLHASGVTSLLHSILFDPLIQKLPHEALDIQLVILDTCYNCIRLGKAPFMPRDALEAGAMEVFTKMLRVGCVKDVAVRVADCVMVLSHYHEGKKLACQLNTIPVLIDLLHNKHSSVRAAAAGALMSITIDVEAKRIVVRENALPVLMDLLKDKNQLLVLNAVKTITNCAEDYRGRFQLHGCIKQLQALFESPRPELAEAAKKAVKVITWRP
ncbi:hypothetical protein SpCBS45565_g06472 [Spizellomyces sp. 'palustris']|nr:hypothetical protein SpCBS45565_g06472 [Spizellomyces sp. 'palustris']